MFVVYLTILGKMEELYKYFSFTNIAGVVLALVCVFWLAILQNKYSKMDNKDLYVSINKKSYIPFMKDSLLFWGITLCEFIATIAYSFAMESDILLSVIAFNSYSVVTIIISRIFLKEKLTKSQYFGIGVVLSGVVLVVIS